MKRRTILQGAMVAAGTALVGVSEAAAPVFKPEYVHYKITVTYDANSRPYQRVEIKVALEPNHTRHFERISRAIEMFELSVPGPQRLPVMSRPVQLEYFTKGEPWLLDPLDPARPPYETVGAAEVFNNLEQYPVSEHLFPTLMRGLPFNCEGVRSVRTWRSKVAMEELDHKTALRAIQSRRRGMGWETSNYNPYGDPVAELALHYAMAARKDGFLDWEDEQRNLLDEVLIRFWVHV